MKNNYLFNGICLRYTYTYNAYCNLLSRKPDAIQMNKKKMKLNLLTGLIICVAKTNIQGKCLEFCMTFDCQTNCYTNI
jgi:hypothetical protein